MPQIELLSQETIDKIAAGEVIERPSSVVKELVENAIDAGANAVTVEIKEGGISLIRITDNGCGIEKSQIGLAFLRHSTSKIKAVEDLMTVTSLGFRGEALSSIAAVAQVELITKPASSFTGSRYLIEGSKEMGLEEIGAPDGTTFLVKNLFYNTPARRKFLKSAQTEGGYINDLMQRMILSHPDISFKFIMNNQVKLQSSGNSNIRDIIYHIYGREIASALLEVHAENENYTVTGFIGKPQISRGNRNFETYFINGRYIKSSLIARAIEESYKPFLMQHQYPFTVLYFQMKSDLLDVNVHPTKMELRFTNQEVIYKELIGILTDQLMHRELIPEVPVVEESKKSDAAPVIKREETIPEPFERTRLREQQLAQVRASVRRDSPYEKKYEPRTVYRGQVASQTPEGQKQTAENIAQIMKTVKEDANYHEPKAAFVPDSHSAADSQKLMDSQQISASQRITASQRESEVQEENTYHVTEDKELISHAEVSDIDPAADKTVYVQESFLDEKATVRHKIIGQVFDTYWLVEFGDKLYIIDQHAAHEKVLYERTMAKLREKEYTSQAISPPILLTLSMSEEETLQKYLADFEKIGYEIAHFGGREYSVCGVPANMFSINARDLIIQMIDELSVTNMSGTPDLILEKVASMSCKAAVKGNNRLSMAEIEALIDELLTLENPYNCPHGRPTIISMTKYELEKKFKRII